MNGHIKSNLHLLVSMAVVICSMVFSKTHGASVIADSKDPNSETGSNPISNNGGPIEEKLDARSIGGKEYYGQSSGGYNSGYGDTSKPSSNYGSVYSGSDYSAAGNYGSGSSYAMPIISYGAGTNGIYSTGNSYGSAYSAANQGPYNSAYGSGSYGDGSSYTRPSYGSSSYGSLPFYGSTPSYGSNPSSGYASGSSYNVPAYGVPSSYGNNVGSPYGNYAVVPNSAYGNNVNLVGSSYGNGHSGSAYSSGSFRINAGSYGENGYAVTSSPYSSYAGQMGSSSAYGGVPYGNYGDNPYGTGQQGASFYSSMNNAYNRNPLGYSNNVIY